MLTVIELIESHREAILERWRAGVETMASARGLSRPELLNLIPDYLAALGESQLATLTLSPRQERLIESHLSHRLRQGYELNELLSELAVLGRIIAELIDEQPVALRPPVTDVAALLHELHLTANAVSKIFTEHLLEDEQRDKRYLRLIHDIAHESLARNGSTPPLEHRLREVLELIMEAMNAQTASLLLIDQREPNALKTVSSAGIADEALAEYVTSIDSTSFASKVAATVGDPLELLDATASAIPVSDSLLRSGIRSLLGVRLPSRHLLRGVLYIGLTTMRHFTASELRRLATLGDRLTVHLDHAELVAELRSKVAALQLFVDVLAHDLRGPIASAKLATSLIARDPATLARYLPRVRSGLDRAERMITDLLDAHRIEAGEVLPLTTSTVELISIANDVAEELDAQFPGRVVVRGPATLYGDWSSPYLRRAIWNMAMNGLKYGAAGAEVTIALRDAGDRVDIAVHNHGAPISVATQRRMFERFSRGVEHRKTKGRGGWGLGLSLVRAAAEAHGGTVDVSSDEGGTTFTISIPRAPIHAPAPIPVIGPA